MSNYPRQEPEPHYFYGSWQFVVRSMPPLAVLLFGLLGLSDIAGDINPWILLGDGIIGFAFLVGVILLCNRLWSVRTSPDGLRTYNGMGNYADIPWDQLTYAGQLNLLGLKYFRLKRPRLMWALLIPVDLENKETFQAQLDRHLGPEHPIANQFRETWHLPNP